MASQDLSSQMVGERLQVTTLSDLEVAAEVAKGRAVILGNVHHLKDVRRRWEQQRSGMKHWSPLKNYRKKLKKKNYN